MKIACEFSCGGDVGRFAPVVTARQRNGNFAAVCLGNDRQYTPRTKGDDLGRHIANVHGTPRRLTRVEARAINHDLAAGNGVRRIDIDDFSGAIHKSRSSYHFALFVRLSGCCGML